MPHPQNLYRYSKTSIPRVGQSGQRFRSTGHSQRKARNSTARTSSMPLQTWIRGKPFWKTAMVWKSWVLPLSLFQHRGQEYSSMAILSKSFSSISGLRTTVSKCWKATRFTTMLWANHGSTGDLNATAEVSPFLKFVLARLCPTSSCSASRVL